MPGHQILPRDVDSLDDPARTDDESDRRHKSKSKSKDRDKDRDRDRDKDRDKDRHYHRSTSAKERDDKEYHRSSTSKDKSYHRSSSRRDKDRDKDKDREHGYHRSSSRRDKDDSSHGYHRSSSSKDKDRDKDRDKHYHRSSSRRSKDYDYDKDRDRHRRHRHDKRKDDLIMEDIDGDDEDSDIDYRKDRKILRQQSRNQTSAGGTELKIDLGAIEKEENKPSLDGSVVPLVEDKATDRITQMLSISPRRSPRPMDKFRGQLGRRGALNSDDRTQLNMFFKESSNQDSLADYLPNNDDAVLESISEILFKPYPWQLKVFAAFICISQFLTLISLFYSLLPCPETKPSWLVFIGVPLCCAYAGIESIHHMLRYIHLGKGYRIMVFLMNVNCLMQLLCVGVVMGKSEDLVSLIGNFVGVAIVLQIDEFLAVYIGIKDINPELLEKKSWRTKMMLKSKMWLIGIAALIVYAVTITCWRVDYLYCDSYNVEGTVSSGVSSTGGVGGVDPTISATRIRF